MDNEIFGSMLSSSRRISKIEVDLQSNDGVNVSRLIDVMVYFKDYLKTLEVKQFPRSTETSWLEFLNAASDVEEMSLAKVARPEASKQTVALNRFRKLKKLWLEEDIPVEVVDDILAAVADDTVQDLVLEYEGSSDGLQAFLNRQNRIKEIEISTEFQYNIDHLALNVLRFASTDQRGRLLPILKNQRLLEILFVNVNEEAEFLEICKIGSLEHALRCRCHSWDIPGTSELASPP